MTLYDSYYKTLAKYGKQPILSLFPQRPLPPSLDNHTKQETDMPSKDPTSKHRIKFDGKFTDEIRRQIRAKRQELGLPYLTVAQYFSINWSTFRKWESGETSNCGLRHRPLIEAFINGDLDEDLKAIYTANSIKYPTMTPPKVYQAMERVANTYTLCAQNPAIGDNLIEKIEQIAFNTLRDLISMPRNGMYPPPPAHILKAAKKTKGSRRH